MARDAAMQRGERPVVFTNLRDREGMEAILDWMAPLLPTTA
jgi:Ni2+-binding GTPase involved in maturation of urease and hydrogenase